MNLICVECGSEMLERRLNYPIKGIVITNVPAMVCSEGHVCFGENVTDIIIKYVAQPGPTKSIDWSVISNE